MASLDGPTFDWQRVALTGVVGFAVGVCTLVTPVADLGQQPMFTTADLLHATPARLSVPSTISTSTDGASIGIDAALAIANNIYAVGVSTGSQ